VVAVGAAGLAGLAVGGCSTDDRADDPAPGPAELAPDVAVATRALSEIGAVRAAVIATLRRYPAARARLAPLAQVHRRHQESLVDAVPDRAGGASRTPAPYDVPRRRQAAFRALAVREQELHDTLDGLALRAESGDFARLLASMGAALGQQLAVWDA
jgi:hypothetical protein